MGGCVGGLLKFQAASIGRTLNIERKQNLGLFSFSGKQPWSSSQDEMDTVGTSYCHDRHPLDVSFVVEGEVESNDGEVFVNHGAITWNQIRRKWVGDQSRNEEKEPREPVISWSTTYDDLLTDTQPFAEPIPLPEMVDFLVDTWHEEGLYD